MPTSTFSPVSLLDTIGRTPLLRLYRLGTEAHLPGVEIYAKAEFQNPGGSVKDRAAAAIIRTPSSRDDCGPAEPYSTQPLGTPALPTP